MTQYVIDIGAVPDDGQGDPLRTAFAFTNDNFSQIFESGPVGSNVKIANNTITTTVINSNLILSPSGIGKIQVNNTLLPRIDNVYDLGSLSQRFNTIYVGSGGLDITGGIVVSGNITADYFIGNGSALTGIVATTGSRVENGNSNITIPAAGSNIFVTVNGTGNIVVFSNTGAYVAGAVSATGNITGNYILGNGALLTGINANYSNANVAAYLPTYTGNLVSLTGPVTTTANVTGANLRTTGQITATGNITGGNVDTNRVNAANITVGGPVSASGNISGNYILGNGALLTGINANYSNANVAAYLPTYTGNLVSLTGPVTTTANVTGANIRATGQITATGNITSGNVDTGRVNAATITASGNVSGAYFLGDGSQLTNLPAGNYSNANVTAYLPTYTGNLVSLAGPVTTTANITGANIRATGQITATGNVTAGNVDTSRVNAATVTVSGPVSASGNVSGAYFLGDGSQLTNLPAGNYSNANVAAYLPTYTGNLVSLTGPVTTTANITGGNLVTSGQATVTGNITAGNVDATKVNAVTVAASGSISAVGNITGNNLIGVTVTGTTVTATANVVGGNITTAGQISSTGNITGGNLSVPGGTVSSLTVSAAGNIRGGNLVTPGFITATGNITGGNVDTGNIHAGNVNVDSIVSAQGNVYGNTFVGNGLVIFGNASLGNTSISGTIGATVVSASGNVIGGNLLTTGQVSATGNIAGNYFVGNGALLTGITVSAGSSLLNGNSNVVVATNGNVTVGVSGISNIAQFANTGAYVTGVISATGNITGSYLLGNGAFITGLPAGYSNADVANYLPTYSGNLPNLTGLVSTTGNIAGNYFIGNGSLLTGVTASGVNANALTGNTLSSTVLYSSLTQVGTLGNLSVAGNTNSGNLLTGGLISATGNITGNYILGNGALLTGVITSVANINLGTSNVTVVSSGGNVTVGIGGTSNVAVFATTGEYVTGVVSASGNITGGNIDTVGLISATGNVSGNYFIGNGSQLTGVAASSVNANALVGNTLSSNVLYSSLTQVGTLSSLTVTGNTTAGNLLTGGLISATGNVIGGNIVTSGSGGNITGANVISATTFSAAANILGGNVLTNGLISATGNATVDNLSTAGLITATGNISGNNIFATGLASVTGNVVAGNVNTGAIRPVSGPLTITTASGNLNLQPAGNIVLANTYINSVAYPAQDTDAATKLYVDNMVSTAIAYHTPVYAATTTTLASSTGGTITYAQPNGVANGVGATLTTTGSFNLVDTSNVQTLGTRILVKDQADAVQNGIYTWANATAIVRATDADEYGPDSSQQISLNDYFFTSTGNVNVGAAFIVNSPPGTITFGTSNITFALFSQTTTYTANVDAGLSLTGTVFSAKVDLDTTAFDAGGNIIVKAGANLTTPNIGAATGTSLSLIGNVNSGNVNTGGLVSATGNITGGNVLTAGLISATGNATLGNVLTGGLVSATANVTAGNLVTGGLITATGNIIVGNVGTAGLISAAGNIQGGNFLTGGLVSATGNATLGNILTSGLISSTGNITSTANILGGNVLTGGLVSVAGNITGGNILSNNYYYANGTPVPPGIVYTANTAPPVSPAPKVTDQWYDTANDVLYQYLDDGTSDYWIDTTSPAFAGGVVANVAISGTLVPVANVTYDIGTSNAYFHSTYTQNLYTNNRLPAYNMPLGAVVQTVMSSSLGGSITNSTSYADISYANVTITPSSATSKVFVMATGTTSFTLLAGQDVTADAQLVRSPSTSLQIQTCGTTVSGGGIGVTGSVSYSYVDNPGTTSPVTYKLQQKVSNASSTLTSTNIWLIAMEITAS